jgi:hypothetical protein
MKHRVEYRGATIAVWRDPTGRWQSCILTPGQTFNGIGPDEDFDTPEAAVDAAMEMVDEHAE